MQLEQYQSRLEGLKADYEAGSHELDYTDNQVKRKKLEREQIARYKDMEQVAQQYDQCEKELKELAAQTGIRLPAQLQALAARHQLLIDILTPQVSSIKTQIETAYQAARPIDWPQMMPKTLKGMLADLENMPLDDQGYSPTVKFVALLAVDTQIQKKQQLCQELQEWAEEKTQDFSEVLEHIRQASIVRLSTDTEQQTHSYLMVVIERSKTADQQKESRYFVKAWFIIDGQTYQPGKKAGFDALTMPGALEDAENAFTVDEIQGLLKAFIDESGRKCLSQGHLLENLTIELFLPSDLLNHAVDRWVMEEIDDEFSMSEPIGFQHRLLVRSSERLRRNYFQKQGASWKNKWKQVRQRMQEQSPQEVVSNGFVSGDGMSVKVLFQQLSQPQMIGLKLVQGPLLIGKGSMFAALQSSATPIAVWLRQPLSSIDCIGTVDQLLCCCVYDLPERVKQHRQAAFPVEPDCHIGHHLALLWEDFDRLPPDLDYHMASA